MWGKGKALVLLLGILLICATGVQAVGIYWSRLVGYTVLTTAFPEGPPYGSKPKDDRIVFLSNGMVFRFTGLSTPPFGLSSLQQVAVLGMAYPAELVQKYKDQGLSVPSVSYKLATEYDVYDVERLR